MNETIVGASQQELQVQAQSWADKARGFRISDTDSCRNASYLLRSIKGVRSDIASWFAPHIEAAMETKRKADAARKSLVDAKDRMEAPLVDAEAVIKRALLAWETAQEQIRLDEERRLQQEAQRHAEALALAAAADMEREATVTGDSEMLQEAHDILDQPVEAPIVVVARAMPKVAGVTYRDAFKAHSNVDVKALAAAVAAGTAPVAFLVPNMTAINQFARATQGEQSVPGIRFYNDRTIAARG